ncbi:hypothetical protein [Campylobacter portucalensis]|nr:hypothetical protein [Campylobacter portucalensis]
MDNLPITPLFNHKLLIVGVDLHLILPFHSKNLISCFKRAYFLV